MTFLTKCTYVIIDLLNQYIFKLKLVLLMLVKIQYIYRERERDLIFLSFLDIIFLSFLKQSKMVFVLE